MNTQLYDIAGIGNAILDVIAPADDAFLAHAGIVKGAMTLIDEARAIELSTMMKDPKFCSGGSAANTIVGAASLGLKTACLGKVRADDHGHAFIADIKASGVHFPVAPVSDGPVTARCLIFVTPDGQRSMNTFLGASQNLGPDDIEASIIQDSSITYLEGYLWDPPAAKKAFLKAAEIAHAAGRRVALTLSDAFCVHRYRTEFLGLMRDRIVDIVFANEAELHALYEAGTFEEAVAALRAENILGVVTRSEKGAMVVTSEEVTAVAAHPIAKLVDTTGAGDLFASGFLTGLVHGAPHAHCARLGALAAAEIIQHIGARPQADLAALARAEGLLA